MTIIGVDVSKATLDAALMTGRGIVKRRFHIANEESQINSLLDSIPAKSLIGAEATGEYHCALARACIARGFTFKLLNPIVTKQFTRATVRKRKTDTTDAEVIARCLMLGEGYALTESSLDPAKRYGRSAEKIRRMEQAVRRMHEQFSEFVSDDPEDMAIFKDLEQAAATASGALRARGLARVSPEPVALVDSIPGIGDLLARTIISEIGDIERFSSGKAFVAYVGLDPRIRQSGTTLAHNTHITKRGSPYLRRALFIAASVAQRCDPELREYYLRKRSEGRRYTEATVANSRRMAHRVYAVLKRRSPYVPALSPPDPFLISD